MAAPTVYQHVDEHVELEGPGQLFAGKKFWVAQRVPCRNQLLADIKDNGGKIVLLEKNADYLIADHVRPKYCPPGSISYEFVDKSIKQGSLRDPEDHRCGPPLGQAREPGAINRPAKGGRAAYTAEEDRILYTWVLDAEAAGGLSSGNEIYKQLEAKYPRHPWQSWRDRYIKQLRTRPPSAFNIPDNAPPSPPSDRSNGAISPRASSSWKQIPRPAPDNEKGKTAKQVSVPAKARTNNEYTLDELAGLFSSEEWEKLYAFVDVIDVIAGQEIYDAAWTGYAEAQGKQTAEQWRQYYEKVVRPQWLRDPAWKREQVKKKHETVEAEQDENDEEDHGEAEQEAAPVPTASKETQPHKPSENVTIEAAKVSSEIKMLSSSTARHESPKYLTELYEKAMKRIRGDDIVEQQEDQGESSRPTKRRKSASATLTVEDRAQQTELIGTQVHPVEISSAEVSSATSQSESVEDLSQEQIRLEMMQSLQTQSAITAHDTKEAESVAESIESDDFPDIKHFPPPAEGHDTESADDLPSNTPTPRGTRRKPSNFDTQAILSSPSQYTIRAIPQPHDQQEHAARTAPRQSSSPPSDESITQSLQEFRRSLNGENDSIPSYPAPNSPLRSASVTPAPSPASSSTGSIDPDPPLAAHEINDFFDERHAEGFSTDFIAKALKRTRLRPLLAVQVLDAWKDGKPLPVQRGIWGVEEDVEVESGDGVALAKLEKKHTEDGWGGVFERVRFLEDYRSR